jgi:C_GCAxxG_C_C family probable redox protein
MEDIMNDPEKAKSTFKEGFSCSQAILSTFCEKFNLDRNIALRLADSFGGGMARMGLTCGAVTGALMVIGLKEGRTSAGDGEAKERTYRLVREFFTRFEKRNGTIACKELLGCSISTDEGLKYAQGKELFTTLCPKFVADAAQILDELI